MPSWSCKEKHTQKECAIENSSVMTKAGWLSFIWFEAVVHLLGCPSVFCSAVHSRREANTPALPEGRAVCLPHPPNTLQHGLLDAPCSPPEVFCSPCRLLCQTQIIVSFFLEPRPLMFQTQGTVSFLMTLQLLFCELTLYSKGLI